MKESTKKELDEAARLVRLAGGELTPAGFVYHSAKTWLALTTDGDVVHHELGGLTHIYRGDYRERYFEHGAPSASPPKKTRPPEEKAQKKKKGGK